jgi:hypothetical protein
LTTEKYRNKNKRAGLVEILATYFMIILAPVLVCVVLRLANRILVCLPLQELGIAGTIVGGLLEAWLLCILCTHALELVHT